MTRERKELRIDTMDTLLELRDDVSTMLGSGASSLRASQADAAASDTPADRGLSLHLPCLALRQTLTNASSTMRQRSRSPSSCAQADSM